MHGQASHPVWGQHPGLLIFASSFQLCHAPLLKRVEETEATAYRKYAPASSTDTEFQESQTPWKQKAEGVYVAFLLGPLQFSFEMDEPLHVSMGGPS